ncbi:hypothetical protein A3N58_13750 [Klebsiella aerogenes]|nr:hypothetical protein A3N58_13750 [Klebsiella aerogenes]
MKTGGPDLRGRLSLIADLTALLYFTGADAMDWIKPAKKVFARYCLTLADAKTSFLCRPGLNNEPREALVP